MGSSFIEDWRSYATRHRLVAAIVGGLVATHVTTNLGMWYHGIGLPDLNFNYLNGLLVFGNSAMDPKGMMDPVILTSFGAAVHYGQGVAFALVYRVRDPPAPADRELRRRQYRQGRHLGPDPRDAQCGVVDQPIPEPRRSRAECRASS